MLITAIAVMDGESSVEIEDCGCMCLVSGLGKINTRLAPGCCAALARTGSGHMYPVTAPLLLS